MSTPITWVDVTAIAPELAGSALTTAAQDAILAFVNEAFVTGDATMGEGQLRLARINLAAHVATLEKRRGSGAAGPMIAESMGQVSRTYANIVQQRLFTGTSYGQVLDMLLRTSLARLPSVIGGFAGRGWGGCW